MEILINELSLDSQYSSIDFFISDGICKLLPLLKEFRDEDVFFKKQDFYNRNVTSQTTIYQILSGSISRTSDELRRFKTHLSRFLNEPYWDNTQIHSIAIVYSFNGTSVTGSSLAESCERDRVVLSFNHVSYLSNQLTISKANTNLVVDNLTGEDDFITLLHQRGLLTFFSLKNRVNFRRTNLIQQGQTVFISNANGSYWYLDNFHKNHYEVFNSNKIHIGVADLNGNIDYTKAVNGRTI